jgi:hypothetical protein
MKNLTLKEYEQFSAYLDGQLSANEKRRLEEQIKRNPDWRLALEELNATRTLLRRAPKYRAPRNFTITPEQARQYARKSWIPSFISFRLSTAVAALAAIAVMLLQLLPSGLGARVAMAPAADSQRTSSLAAPTQEAMKALEAPQESAPSFESPAAQGQGQQPPIIMWGDNSGMVSSRPALGFGMGGGGGGGGGDGSGGSGQFLPGNGIVTYNQQQIGSPMYGGAADTQINPSTNGGIVNYGGQPSPDQSVPADNYSPPFNVPPQSAETLPEQPPQTIAPANPANSAGLEGSGPILGIPSSDTAGKIIAVGPITPAQEPSIVSTEPTQNVTAQPAASFWSATRIAQAALLGLALLAAVFAVLVRRRNP